MVPVKATVVDAVIVMGSPEQTVFPGWSVITTKFGAVVLLNTCRAMVEVHPALVTAYNSNVSPSTKSAASTVRLKPVAVTVPNVQLY